MRRSGADRVVDGFLLAGRIPLRLGEQSRRTERAEQPDARTRALRQEAVHERRQPIDVIAPSWINHVRDGTEPR